MPEPRCTRKTDRDELERRVKDLEQRTLLLFRVFLASLAWAVPVIALARWFLTGEL